MKSEKWNKSRFKFSSLWSTFVLLMVLFFLGCSGGGGGSSNHNGAPTANAGADQTVTEGDTVTLDGSGSSDSDGNIASYSWSQTGDGISVVLTNSDTANATFTAPNVDSNTVLTFTLTVNDNSGASSSDNVNITVNNSNNLPPSADAGTDQTVDEGDTVTLDGSSSSDSDGTVSSYQWSQTGGSVNAILTNANSASLSFIAPYVTTSTDLTFTLEVTDNIGDTDSDTVTVTVNNSGSIVGSVSTLQGQVDLGVEGDLDWAHWGLDDAGSFNQKDTGGGAIGNFAFINDEVPNIVATRFENSPIAFTWSSGGTPTASATDTTTGLYFGIPGLAIDEGVRLTVDAGTAEKTLKLYLGTTSAEAKLTATLSDGTAPAYEVTMNNTFGYFVGRVVTLTFAAESDSQKLTVDFTLLNDTGPDLTGAINILAASLTNGKVQTPTISQSAATSDSIEVSIAVDNPGATIRYTTDGSDPDANSTTYTGPFDLDSSATVKAVGFLAGLTASDVAETDFVVSATTGGNLTAVVADAPATVDLETEGGLDWSHWGLTAETDWNQKATGGGAIGNYADIIIDGGINVDRFDNSPIAISWSSGGTPTTSTTDTTTGLYFPMDALAVGEGFRLTVDADTSEKELKLYIGTTSVEATLTATFSDDTVPAYETTISNILAISKMRVVTIDYSAASDGQTLTIDYTLSSDTGVSGGAINLQAATLD